MSERKQTKPDLVEIRRYSNRRFYDTSQSKHVTLEEIREIVRSGRDVRITEASTGEDITARTLTQIILDYDNGKIAAFPAGMLHRLIRSSESLLLDFIGKSFENATQVFQDSQRSAGEQWRKMAGMAAAQQDPTQWWKGAMEGGVPPWVRPGEAQGDPREGNGQAQDLERMVEELRGQLNEVQSELKDLRKKGAKSSK